MAKESSVAPKERVNIVYKPATGDAKEEVELPLKVLVTGDFTGAPDDTPVEDRETININKDNFDDVLAAMNVKLETVVKNKLSDDPEAEMTVTLEFKSMKDFEPDAIVEKIPELKKLKEIRDALKAVKGPLGNIPEFRKKISELIQDKDKRDKLFKELGIEE
ncbi:MAG: type VI secretion system contractile sheath small subunit [Desulfonauticus sp.]|nr:type VI secretion system contractile sheath small subunit [Desulfonauticus sp.]